MTYETLIVEKDRAYWLDVNLTVRGQVSGSEPGYVGLVHLPGLSGDYAIQAISPPGVVSPYGTSTSCSNPN